MQLIYLEPFNFNTDSIQLDGNELYQLIVPWEMWQ